MISLNWILNMNVSNINKRKKYMIHAFCGIIAPIIFTFVLLILGFLFTGIANPVSDYIVVELDLIEKLYVKGGWFYFLGYLLKWFFGGQLSFFPLGAYSIFGALAGYLLAMKVDFKFFRR